MATGNRNRQKQSWVRRRRRRIKLILTSLLLIIVVIVAGYFAQFLLSYEEVDLCELFTVEYEGYDSNGTATAVVLDDRVDALLSTIKQKDDSKIIQLKNIEGEDYVNFRTSLTASITPANGLSNGSLVTLNVSYDKELADKLKLDVSNISKQFMVDGLPRVTVISEDQLYEPLQVTFSGISPAMTVNITSYSEHPFLKTIGYEIVNPKEYYAEGDQIEVHAIYDAEAALAMQYLVAEGVSDVRTYTAHSDSVYVSNPADISTDIIQAAIEAGKSAFTNANEYGVGIFCEGHLVPVYINKQATFEWGTPVALSAYFKTVHSDKGGEAGYHYNDLDIIYKVPLSQADGKACTSYCAVRFSNFVKNADGSISYDFSDAKVFSASYYVERVKKNVIDFYLSDYEVDKVY